MKQSLYERIRSDFETRILRGEMAPGDRLPIEQDLVQQYGCSRMTVNKALTALANAGLIDRRKRAGTFVARPKVHSMVLDVPDLAATVRARGQDYGYVALRRHVRTHKEQLPEHAALAAGGPLLELDCLHLANGIPLAVEHRLISVKSVPEILAADLESVPPGTWLLQHIPWTEVETRISGVAAEPHEASHLKVKTGTACLQVERHTWRGSDAITYVRQIFPGDAYDLVARFGQSATADPAPRS
ncbi:histidine utilization repressor [Sphingomonas sp. SRS2]|uniref:histidine utilization repressor n=1 Tax=Sphingomonas sp. SRS2 TaxID=133190 RepID=UPI000618497E|nr:histidine utilization repressor [Sphingomonas sp. SRS2]KKC24778.1 GntR family transcriptional regulator [Sphingomonas sp. SRS2]